jgi:hypothetical protein
MSIPELATLMFIISLWVLSIFCCIKRYEKISTIERADMPQYRKSALDPLANSAEASSASKSPPNVASPVRSNTPSTLPNSPNHVSARTPASCVPTAATSTATTTAPVSTGMYSSSSRLLASTNNRDSMDFLNYGANRAAGEQTLVRMLSAYDSTSMTANDTAQPQQPKQIYYEVVLSDEKQRGVNQYQKNPTNRQRSNNNNNNNKLSSGNRRQNRDVAQKQLSMQLPLNSNPNDNRASMGSIPYSHFKNVSLVLNW